MGRLLANHLKIGRMLRGMVPKEYCNFLDPAEKGSVSPETSSPVLCDGAGAGVSFLRSPNNLPVSVSASYTAEE
jgi:hypothetical protein